MQEVTGPVVAIVLVLCAVFIPVSFLGGLAGELYRQFAVTIAVSVVISGIVALTLTPALARSSAEAARTDRRGGRSRWFNRGFAWLTARYTAGVGFLLRRTVLGCLGFVLVLGAVFALFQRIPGSLRAGRGPGLRVHGDGAAARRRARAHPRGHQGGDGGADEEPGGGQRRHLLRLRPPVACAEDPTPASPSSP